MTGPLFALLIFVAIAAVVAGSFWLVAQFMTLELVGFAVGSLVAIVVLGIIYGLAVLVTLVTKE